MSAPTITPPSGLDVQGRSAAPVTIGGVELKAGSTAAERFEAHVKAGSVPHQGGIGHTDGTVTRMNYGDAQATPTKPVEAKPPEQPQVNSVEAFDAEMRAAGKQIAPTAPPPTAAELQELDVALLTEQYLTVMQGRSSMPEEQRLRFKAAYERDVARVLDGTLVLTAAQRAKMTNPAGKTETFVPKVKESKPAEQPAASQYTPEQWAKGHESVLDANGQIPVERLNPAGLSGYKIEKLVEGQTASPEVFRMLAVARAAGASQAVVSAFIREELKAGGWLK